MHNFVQRESLSVHQLESLYNRFNVSSLPKLAKRNGCSLWISLHRHWCLVGSNWDPPWKFFIRYKSRRIAHTLTLSNTNPNIKKIQYAVRGPLVIRALELEKQLKGGLKKPFSKVIRANIGDSQAMHQKPITFIRQVLACVAYPALIDQTNLPEDVKYRAREILCACGGNSIGSYTLSNGIEMIRRHVAEFIQRRDCYPANWKDIVLTNGVSTAIKNCLQLFANTGYMPAGVMVPIPQYPLYSAAISEFGLYQVDYFLDEDNNWGVDIEELERAAGKAQYCCELRVMVVINPGNPTGQVLTRRNIEDIIMFAKKHKLFLFADEVYQFNIHDPCSQFHSFKKVMREMGAPYDQLELVSFNSASKGYAGECGIRGGWMEIVNMHPDVKTNLYKSLAANLCATSMGQTVIDCIAKPPAMGDPSYELFCYETYQIANSLKDRAFIVSDSFNCMKGFQCNPVQGALYAFPQIKLSKKAIRAAKREKQLPDVFYAFRLLECTGICVIPGSGFGQKPGTYHFRTTIVPPTEALVEMLSLFQTFHERFTRQF